MARVTLFRAATADTTTATIYTTGMMIDKNDGWFTFTRVFMTFAAFMMLMLTFMMFVFTIIISPNNDLSAALYPAILFHFIAALITHSFFTSHESCLIVSYG
ncbi:hypothetical protein [Priestia abyssalis]|uniref:hypothetical protein n=1 Tax=Priestia abyssalis TaxID=1221450 RepID=UPI0009948F6B|nr:hypothetical protein [Priestia abyssalis]